MMKPSGLLSLLGGKWTTYRLMAQDAIDRVGERLNNVKPGSTETHYLVGGEDYRFEDWQTLQTKYGFPMDVCQHLMRTYGNRADRVAQLTQETPALADKLTAALPFIKGGSCVSGTGRDGRYPPRCAGPSVAAGAFKLAGYQPACPPGCWPDGC